MFRKHAIAILPDPDCFKLRLLCLRHYVVPSLGWSFGSGCAICRDVSREQVRPTTGCLAPDVACSCTICARQPNSLRDLAFNAHFLLVLNIERFKLTRNVTYSQYRFACESGRVDIERLLPPDFPSITVLYNFSCCSSRPAHATCSPVQSWIAAATGHFSSQMDAVSSIYAHKSHYWCTMCEKPLFFKNRLPLARAYWGRSSLIFQNDRIHYSKFKITFPSKFKIMTESAVGASSKNSKLCNYKMLQHFFSLVYTFRSRILNFISFHGHRRRHDTVQASGSGSSN